MTIGIKNLNNDIGSAGVGFVVIPEYADRDQYIKDCYRTNTLTINGGLGYGFFSNINVDQSLMQEIKFPIDKNNRGTSVIWVKDSISQLPVIIGSLRKQEDYQELDENQFIIKRSGENGNVEIFLDGDKNRLDINLLNDNELENSVFNIKLNSKNKNSVFNIQVDNEINIKSEKTINISSSNSSLNILNGNEKNIEIFLSKSGLLYKDDKNNQLKIGEDGVNIISDNIIQNSGDNHIVLGEKLNDMIKELIDLITKIKVTTPSGISSPPINSPEFLNIKTKLSEHLSNKSRVE